MVKIKERPATKIEPGFHPKDFEDREIPLPDHCIKILEDLRAFNEMTDEIDYVCLDRRQYETMVAKYQRFRAEGRPWRNSDFQNNTLRTFQKDYEKTGIVADDPLTLHVLRKCACKNWAKVNRNPEVTRRLAGHSQLSTTMEFYNQVEAEEMSQSASDINALFFSRTDAESDAGR